MQNANDTKKWFRVIHPLDDAPEEKVDVSCLGLMPMTRSVKWSLMALRVYVILMIGLVFVKVIVLAKG
jgi:hypothetical protein